MTDLWTRRATFKTPITVEDVLISQMIAYPFGRRHCSRFPGLRYMKRPGTVGLLELACDAGGRATTLALRPTPERMYEEHRLAQHRGGAAEDGS